MPKGYFHRVAQETSTRMWLNNPVGQEIGQAIAAGAVSCTTNPAYCARVIADEPEFIRPIVDDVIKVVSSDDVAAEVVYQKASARIVEQFLPIFEASQGANGFVTIQGSPFCDEDPDYIVNEAFRHRKVGKNVMAKIPAHEAGIQAIESLVERNVPVCATEIFSVAQAVAVGETYQQAAQRSGNRPPFYVTHITGWFDKYMAEYVKREHIDIAPEVLIHAGWAVAHEQYRVYEEHGYEGIMLGGGALDTLHFTEMVGGDAHVTLNWNISEQLIATDPPVVPRLDVPAPKEVVEELSQKLPAIRQAMTVDGLSIEEFKDFGPLVLFRNMFLQGYSRLVQEIGARRVARGIAI